MEMRIGIGNDVHRLEPGGPLRLGGVEIPHHKQMVGYSDADALLHAIIDAMLGAVGEGDIGQWFPDTSQENKGRNSSEMLVIVRDHLAELGWQIINLDCIIMAERPKLGAFKLQIKQNLAALLSLAPERVNVKAKTGEGVDAVGHEEAVSTMAVVLLGR